MLRREITGEQTIGDALFRDRISGSDTKRQYLARGVRLAACSSGWPGWSGQEQTVVESLRRTARLHERSFDRDDAPASPRSKALRRPVLGEQGDRIGGESPAVQKRPPLERLGQRHGAGAP